MRTSERYFIQRIQRSRSQMSGDCLWWCSRKSKLLAGGALHWRRSSRVNFMIWWNCLKSVGIRRTRTIFSWAIMSIAGIIQWRLSHSSLHSKCATKTASPSFVAITNLDRSPKSTVSTTNASANTATPTSGSISPTCSTTCPWQRSSTTRSSVCTVASVHR